MNETSIEKSKRPFWTEVSDAFLEREFLCRIVNDPKLLKEVYGYITKDDFHADPTAYSIYSQICEDFENSREWSILTVKHDLANKGRDVLIGDYVNPETITKGEFDNIVDRLKKSSMKRVILERMEEMLADEDEMMQKDIKELVSTQLDFYSKMQMSIDHHLDFGTILSDYYKLNMDRIAQIQQKQLIPTGFREIDALLNGGLATQDLVIIGARPSVGKTAVSLSIAYNAAKAGHRTMFASVEMRAVDVLDRLLAFELNSSLNLIIRGGIAQEKIEEGIKKLSELPLTIFELINATSGDVMNAVAREKFTKGLELVVVDYLQMLRDDDDERTSVNKSSRNLKTMARIYNVAVITPSQLTRESVKGQKEDGKMLAPQLHQLKESGNIEADADVVMLMLRATMGQRPDDTTLKVAKNRKGSTGEAKLTFSLETTYFHD